ncbi:hypothetical protein K2173_001146 [Erythroxylum novogranatense]|uniref:Cyclin-dependent kinase inhibitor domain-containing protein n=1 Tax=Erythroxylum novogranatense TaxID=1862640 RepID=A0AAV8TIE3_9ROSI|nr:hypothetical protein K2173_001146 [Erythroxylum novogranatense]
MESSPKTNGKRVVEETESSGANLSKKLRIELHLSSPSMESVLHGHRRSTIAAFLPGDIFSGGLLAGSLCSNNDSCDLVQESTLVDLQSKSFETEGSTCINNNKFSGSRETTPSSFFCEPLEDEDMDTASPEKKKDSPEREFPTQKEIDDFFAEEEKKEQKRFSEKYNFDIVKDLPLEGRYQWVRLKP